MGEMDVAGAAGLDAHTVFEWACTSVGWGMSCVCTTMSWGMGPCVHARGGVSLSWMREWAPHMTFGQWAMGVLAPWISISISSWTVPCLIGSLWA